MIPKPGKFNQWYHTVTVINRNLGNIKFYLDGTLLSSGTVRTTDTVSSSNSLRIGWTQEANSAYTRFHGQVDNLRIYDYAIDGNIVDSDFSCSRIQRFAHKWISSFLAFFRLSANFGEQTCGYTDWTVHRERSGCRLAELPADSRTGGWRIILYSCWTTKRYPENAIVIFDYETDAKSYGIRVRVNR